ncbi:MAG TPA: hypothetical protein PKM25_17170, partial [Candidatus Ozemobacteraceae bacterium]|nr:hypothetical protein [Candidatus Ozemobacteraceae bacterium]
MISDNGDAYAGGMIAFFEEQDIPRDLALRELLGRFNTDAGADEGYALCDLETPSKSYGIRTVSKRLSASSRQIFRRALGLRNSYQRQNQDKESLISIVSLDAGRMVLAMKRLESGLEWHLRFSLELLSGLILVVVGYWSWRLHLSGEWLYVSIRHKLVALFLYATAIPVTALMLLGYQYMLDRNQVMVQERLVQLSGLIENIDDSFQAAVRSLEQLYRKVSRLPAVQRGDISQVNALFTRMKDAELLTQAFMVDSKGRLQLMEMSSQGKDLLGKLIPTLARKIFQSRLGQNEEDLKAKVSDVMVESLTDSVSEFMAGKGSQKIFGELIESNDKIIEFMLGKNGNLMYSTFLWGEGQKQPANLLLIVHRARSFAEKYLERLVGRNHRQPENENPVRLAIVSRVNENHIYPVDYTKYLFVREMSDKVGSTETQHNSVEEIGGEPYLVVASPLKKMPDFILMAMYPRRLIDDVIRGISLKIGSIAVVSGFFAFF